MKMWKSVQKVNKEFLWKPLKPKFQNALMSSNFVIKECDTGSDNCIFKCLETALQSDNIKIEEKYIKKNFIKYIKNFKDIEAFKKIINLYIGSSQNGFKREWEPRAIAEPKELAKLMKETEFFVGNDYETLLFLSIHLGVEFMIFDEKFKARQVGNEPSIIYLYYDSKKEKYNIIGLKYYEENEIVTKAIFHKNDLPTEIKVIRDIRTYLLENAKKVFFKAMENKESFAMDELVKRVDDIIYLELDDNIRQQLEDQMVYWLTK